MEHSIKRLAEAMYYQHSVSRRRSYPWEVARHQLRRMSKEEVKERLLQDVHQKGWRAPQGMSQMSRSATSRVNNAQGRLMEDMILGACRDYESRGIARIVKMPEPFRVMRNTDRGRGIATVRFTGRAEPDFVGCLAGGRMIAFESKYTTADRIQQRVVTDAQAEALKRYTMLGASTYVCCGIGTGYELSYHMVPWSTWAHMGVTYGRKYMTREDARMYRVKADTVIHFLDNI